MQAVHIVQRLLLNFHGTAPATDVM
jgi:hypothetical protein